MINLRSFVAFLEKVPEVEEAEAEHNAESGESPEHNSTESMQIKHYTNTNC